MLQLLNLKNGKPKGNVYLIHSISFSELNLEDTLKKRNTEFRALEEQLRQFEEKVKNHYPFVFF